MNANVPRREVLLAAASWVVVICVLTPFAFWLVSRHEGDYPGSPWVVALTLDVVVSVVIWRALARYWRER